MNEMHYINYCECGGSTKVVDSRPKANGTIKRRKECMKCGKRFNTIEVEQEYLEDRKVGIRFPRKILMQAENGSKVVYVQDSVQN